MSWRGASFWIGVLASLAVHLLMAFALLRLPGSARLGGSAVWEVTFEAATPPSDDPAASRQAPYGAAPDDRAAPLEPGGARSAQNIDTFHRGDRGDGRGASDVILLLPRSDAITLQDSPMNALGVAQTQRIRTASTRGTQEDRRATPNPADEAYLASGPGTHAERRPVSAADAREGARIAPDASERGADVDRAALPPGERRTGAVALAPGAGGHHPLAPATQGAAAREPRAAGGPMTSPGRGIADGQGVQQSEAARVATARPPVDPGPAATNSELRDVHVRDDVDAELLAARMIQSMVESTARRGNDEGMGVGGVGGGGDPGVGGSRGAGGSASPHGPGQGRFASLDTSDARYMRWFLDQRRRVGRALVFPRSRQLAMDQGVSVYRITVRRDGTLAHPPHLLRSSGFQDLDQAALAAIVRSVPFAPLPDDLAPGTPAIRVTMPIEFSNPMAH